VRFVARVVAAKTPFFSFLCRKLCCRNRIAPLLRQEEEGGGKTNQKKINHRNAIWRSNIELQNSLFLPKNAEIFFDCV
jgi:hypothetical protein